MLILYFIFFVNLIVANQDLSNLQVSLFSLKKLSKQLGTIFPPVKALNFGKSFSLDLLAKECFKQKEISNFVVPSLIDYEDFKQTIDEFKELLNKSLGQKKLWFQEKMPTIGKKFNVFVQKIVLPDSEKSPRLALWGDLHGSLHSLLRNLLRLKQVKAISDDLKLARDIYFIFLGDYEDRGKFGLEIIYTLMKLKLANPNQVYMVRGNHDDYSFNKIFKLSGINTLHGQILKKFLGKPESIIRDTYSIFDYIPEALFIGVKSEKVTNYVQCCHGAFEVGYNAKLFLDSNKTFDYIEYINRKTNIKDIEDKEILDAINKTVEPAHLQNFVPKGLVTRIKGSKYTRGLKVGFSWHEFIVGDDKKIIDVKSGSKMDRELIYGKKLTQYLFDSQSSDKSKLRAIFRGHQHHDEMEKLLRSKKNQGVYGMWREIGNANQVITIFSGPANYRNIESFPYDAFCFVTFAKDYNKWAFYRASFPII